MGLNPIPLSFSLCRQCGAVRWIGINSKAVYSSTRKTIKSTVARCRPRLSRTDHELQMEEVKLEMAILVHRGLCLVTSS